MEKPALFCGAETRARQQISENAEKKKEGLTLRAGPF